MTRRAFPAAIVAVWVLAGVTYPCPAGEPNGVTVREGKLELPRFTSRPRYTKNRNTNSAFHPIRGSRKPRGRRTLKLVVLENRYLTVSVCPELGGPVVRVVDRKTGDDLFHREGKVKDWIPYWESGVKVSFPFREHGVRVDDQPAGYHVVRGDDGSVTVAMWMEFSRFNRYENRWQFGRFSTMTLSQLVTLRPGEAVFTVRYRVVNPTPYRQGRQLWNDALFPRNHTPDGVVTGANKPPRGKSPAELIYPFRYASDHHGKDFRELKDRERLVRSHTRRHTSMFAWGTRLGFAGLYYPSVKVNRLRIFDPNESPGAKVYLQGEGRYHGGSPTTHMYNFVELWGGTHHVFEGVEDWVAPGETFEMTHHFGMVYGIGKADWADRTLAVHAEFDSDEPRIEIAAFRPLEGLEVLVDGEVIRRDASAGPHEPLRVKLDESKDRAVLTVRRGGKVLLDRQLPVEIPSGKTLHEKIRRSLRGDVPANHEKTGEAFAWGKGLHVGANYDPNTVARGRVAYRKGQLAAAVKTLRAALAAQPDDGEGWHLLGVALLESDEDEQAGRALRRAVDVKDSYPAARYYLALRARRAGDTDKALKQLEALLDARPGHWEARLLRAAWLAEGDDPAVDTARALTATDPGDPRAQWVLARALESAGLDDQAEKIRKGSLASLMKEPGAERRMKEFTQAAAGVFVHPQRLELKLGR